MQTKYVVVKGRYGMGGRINVVLAALDYAQQTSRELVVDWSDGFYGSHQDTFSALFENPVCRLSELQAQIQPDQESAPLSVHPEAWRDFVFENGDQPVETKLYMTPPPNDEVDADVVVVTWVSNTLSDDRLSDLAKSLLPTEQIRRRVTDLSRQFDLPNAIGVHYRHGNGELGVVCPDPAWFVSAIRSLDPTESNPIFLCTDSRTAETYFGDIYGDRLKVAEKEFPEIGPLHNNPEIADKTNNAIEALVDLYALASCRHLVDSGEFFGKTAGQLGAGSAGSRTTYPGMTRLFNSQQSNLQGSDLSPVAAEGELLKQFLDAGVRPDNLFLKRTERGLAQLFYGKDFVAEFDLNPSGLQASVREAILRRRMYL